MDAADLLGCSERTFRRLRGRYEAEGASGLLDRRLGKVSVHRIGADEVERIVAIYRDRYAGWTVKHFHERAQDQHGAHRELRLDQERAARLRAGAPGEEAGGASKEAAAQAAARDDAAPGRLALCLAARLRAAVRPDLHADDATSEITSAFRVEAARGILVGPQDVVV